MAQQQQQQPEEEGLTGQLGPVEVNWPKAAGYYGGIGLAAFYGKLRNTSFKGPPFILTEEPTTAEPPKEIAATPIHV